MCKFRNTNKWKLRRHIEQMHGRELYTCDKCDEKFADTSLLDKHRESNHSQTQYQCTQCNKTFKAKRDLNKHIANNHDGHNISGGANVTNLGK